MMVEFLCTLTGLIAGIAVVASLQRTAERPPVEIIRAVDSVDAERMRAIARQLQVLTQRVAADVSAHNQKVALINDSLNPEEHEPERIFSAITGLIDANEKMQNQLDAAQNLITQQSQQLEITSSEARTDALTGLANRRALDEYLNSTIQATKQSEPSALMLLDIDRFKTFNDEHGHIIGDHVLASFALALGNECKGKYFVGRYGGEEFGVVITATSMDDIAEEAAKIRDFVSSQSIEYESLKLTVTASAGLTQLKTADTIQQAYERADQGLYRAKKNGRNCGYWFKSGDWVRFGAPQISDTGATLNNSNEGEIATSQVNEKPPAGPMAVPASKDKLGVTKADILDRGGFVQRVDMHLAQLSRAGLPAVAIMLDAVGLDQLSPKLAEGCWGNTITIVQSQVRGIDVLCRYRQHTLCILMPGLTLDAAIERANGMQHSLLNHRRTLSLAGPLPESFSISVAVAKANEEREELMKRLEFAREQPRDIAAQEIIIHEGTQCAIYRA